MQQVKTIDIRGKQYVPIVERVRILHDMRKSGEIKEFEMVESCPFEIAGQPYWRVSARIDGKLYIGSAEIKLNAPKNTPDGSNPIACAETSAFGRMLAFAGLGTIDSIASAEEVMQAMAEQESHRREVQRERLTNSLEKASSQQLDALSRLYEKLNQAKPDLSELNATQAAQSIRELQAEIKKGGVLV